MRFQVIGDEAAAKVGKMGGSAEGDVVQGLGKPMGNNVSSMASKRGVEAIPDAGGRLCFMFNIVGSFLFRCVH